MNATVSANRLKATNIRPTAATINPRQKLHLERIVEYVAFRGGKIHMDGYHYATLHEEWPMLQGYQVDAAFDLGYALGVLDIRLGGRGIIVEVVSSDVEAAIASTVNNFADATHQNRRRFA